MEDSKLRLTVECDVNTGAVVIRISNPTSVVVHTDDGTSTGAGDYNISDKPGDPPK